jgi:GxxExxY protein
MDIKNEINTLTEQIIGCAIRVHRELGPGLLESTYEQCLAFELARLGFKYELQKNLPVVYQSVNLDCGYRIDILVENSVIVDLKSVASSAVK